jgi:hypothetical protein
MESGELDFTSYTIRILRDPAEAVAEVRVVRELPASCTLPTILPPDQAEPFG